MTTETKRRLDELSAWVVEQDKRPIITYEQEFEDISGTLFQRHESVRLFKGGSLVWQIRQNRVYERLGKGNKDFIDMSYGSIQLGFF